tara:strand:+ start:10136 stop:11602 length:1467 start_codon:yes stop_codon:yes gene_type:complete
LRKTLALQAVLLLHRKMPGELKRLQNELLKRTLRILLIPAVPAFLHSGWQNIQGGDLDRLLFLYTPLMLAYCIIVFVDRIPYAVRSGSIIVILTAVSTSELVLFGLASLGFMFFSLATLMATVFHGLRIGLISLAVFVTIALLSAYGYDTGWIPIRGPSPQQLVSAKFQNWITPILFFILAGGGGATMTWTLLSGLSGTLEKLFMREKELEELTSGLEEKVTHRTRELEEMYATAQEELALAARTQESFLAQDARSPENWEVAIAYQPYQMVSGDVYDLYFRDGQLLGVSLFDVSGHGVASGLLTLMTRSLARSMFFEDPEEPLSHTMDRFNARLTYELKDLEYHVTGVMLRFFPGTNDYEYANAGHPEILHRIPGSQSQSLEPFKSSGIEDYGALLGIHAVARNHTTIRQAIQPGDTLLLFTDGLEDLRSESGHTYGSKRLQELFASIDPQLTAQEQLNEVLDTLHAFRGNQKITDDITALVLKRLH